MGPEDGEARVQHVPHPQLLLAQLQHPGHRGVVSAQGEDGPQLPQLPGELLPPGLRGHPQLERGQQLPLEQQHEVVLAVEPPRPAVQQSLASSSSSIIIIIMIIIIIIIIIIIDHHHLDNVRVAAVGGLHLLLELRLHGRHLLLLQRVVAAPSLAGVEAPARPRPGDTRDT